MSKKRPDTLGSDIRGIVGSAAASIRRGGGAAGSKAKGGAVGTGKYVGKGGAVGGTVGAVVGGPLGAAVGAGIGSAIFPGGGGHGGAPTSVGGSQGFYGAGGGRGGVGRGAIQPSAGAYFGGVAASNGGRPGRGSAPSVRGPGAAPSVRGGGGRAGSSGGGSGGGGRSGSSGSESKFVTRNTPKKPGDTAANTPAPTAPAEPKQKTIQEIVDGIIHANVTQNTALTGTYQAHNKDLQSKLTSDSASLAGAWGPAAQTVAPVDPTLGGSGNAQAATAVASQNAISTSKDANLREYLKSSTVNTLGALAGSSNAAGLANTAYGQAQGASRSGLIQSYQDQQDAQAVKLQDMAMKATALGNTAAADAANLELRKLQIQQTGAYQQGQLANASVGNTIAAARVDASTTNAASAASARASAAGQKANTAARKQIAALEKSLFPTTSVGSTSKIKRDSTGKSLGSSSTKQFAEGHPGHPLRDSIDALVQQVGLTPDNAAVVATQWAQKHTPKMSFKDAYGTYVAYKNRGVSESVARQLVQQSYHIPKFDPVAARKQSATIAKGVTTAVSGIVS